MRSAAVISVVLWLFAGPAARADECPLDTSRAVSLGAEQLRVLMATRAVRAGLSRLELWRVEEQVGSYLGALQAPGDVRPRGLLFYVADRDIVCALYWQSPGESGGGPFPIVERLPVATAGLVALIERNVAKAVGIGGRSERSPRPRREAPAAASRGADPLAARATGRTEAAPLLAELAAALLPGELAERVETLSSLSIVPALNIGTVPFAALDPDRDGRPMAETTPFNMEGSILDVVSGRLHTWDGEVGAAAVFGDPDADDDPDWLLPRLPGAAREAEAVAALLDTKAVTGAEVTPERVLSALPDASYVHIAAHGISSAEDPIDGSFLALSGGRLTARTIQELSLSRKPLVVLSACQTGLGGPLEAGIIGLARGFILAGAGSVVVSLWNVDDEATRHMLTGFVRELAEHAPAEALRRAQLASRARWPEPAYWAPFVAFGPRIVKR